MFRRVSLRSSLLALRDQMAKPVDNLLVRDQLNPGGGRIASVNEGLAGPRVAHAFRDRHVFQQSVIQYPLKSGFSEPSY